MTFEAEFLSLMRTPVTYKALASRDGWGAPTQGTGVALVAQVTYNTMIVRGDTEENQTSTAQINLPPPGFALSNSITVPTIAMSGTVTLPDGVVRRVLKVTMPFDESGTAHHQEVALT